MPSRPLKETETASVRLRAEEQPEETGGGLGVFLWAGPPGPHGSTKSARAHGAEVLTPLPPGADCPLE